MDFWKLVSDVAEAAKELHKVQLEREMCELMTELEDFNKRNYKDAAIDVALATVDREAFEKLVGSE